MRKRSLGGVTGNKWWDWSEHKYHDTRVLFVTAHLAAGNSSVNERNRDDQTITNGFSFPGRPTSDHDVIFWVGDFNYRVNLPKEDVRELLEVADMETMLSYDQTSYCIYSSFPIYRPPTTVFSVFDINVAFVDERKKNAIECEAPIGTMSQRSSLSSPVSTTNGGAANRFPTGNLINLEYATVVTSDKVPRKSFGNEGHFKMVGDAGRWGMVDKT
ncbi:hypothetical protein BJ742DRAFT_777284 [Cladochytrium replicatum]|nr:hypothetical protein BJ742DRAFT_777284 [Cladochytrium replicatum]